ncbi:hypothetical protein NCC78_05645 [Micromonospora phytophila]|uniref:hypothetical protein n=1 Tax=Micromonospora phytophila TaxID=709888 RepID=UPI0020302DC2|nr:hypothetical protein [Micromonospora phytophila]MCM0674176.1 hypothetical protein [Micromonospora phytophila]
MSGILVHAITAAATATATANSIALLHRTPDRPHARVWISCTSPGTCEENEWAESYLAQVVADAAARRQAS